MPRWQSTWTESSILQAMPLQCILKWNGLLLHTADALQNAFCQIQLFEIVKVLEDGFADVESLGAASASGEFSSRRS